MLAFLWRRSYSRRCAKDTLSNKTGEILGRRALADFYKLVVLPVRDASGFLRTENRPDLPLLPRHAPEPLRGERILGKDHSKSSGFLAELRLGGIRLKAPRVGEGARFSSV